MFKPLLILSAAALAMALVGLPAVADDEPPADAPDAAGLFKQLDTNTDGLLDGDEIPQERKTLFERLLRKGDKNKDDKLDAAEFAAALDAGEKTADAPNEPKRPERPERANRPERPEGGRLFERLDANKDGKIELSEVPEPARARFEKLIARADKDGDGAVTRREFLQAGPPGGEPGKPPAKPQTPDAAKKAKRPEGGAGAFFKRVDRNADGKLTADEVPEERRPMVEKLIERGDKDGDGALSRQELTAVFDRRSEGKPPAGDSAKRRKRAAIPASFGGMPGGLFGALDANRDGRLDSGEIGGAAEALKKLDKDGDGTVTAREIMGNAVRKKDK